MKREDLRKYIIPLTLYNTNNEGKLEIGKLDTEDLLYIPTETDCLEMNRDVIRKAGYNNFTLTQDISEGQFQKKMKENMDDLYMYQEKTIKGNLCQSYYIRTCKNEVVRKVTQEGYIDKALKTEKNHIGVRVSLYFKIPEKTEELKIGTGKDKNGNERYHTLHIGEYPRGEVIGKAAELLENLYNNGILKEDIKATGRWYSTNGNQEQRMMSGNEYQGKHNPEFEYNGKRFVRIMVDPKTNPNQYTEGSIELKQGRVKWLSVEPVSFIVLNWDNLPKDINPKGMGTHNYFKLISEDVLISNMPFYPNLDDKNSELWQNSTIRGFLNGIDVRNITENGNSEYGASSGGDFRGECNFLNETFNLSRKPIIEYTIPESEESIPEDAFNGCITLKKLNLHNNIKDIGKRAFNGIPFQYVYKKPTGEVMFSTELLKDIDESIEKVEIEQLKKALSGLNYNIFLKGNKMDDIIILSERLNKMNYAIPYIFGEKLLENGLAYNFFEKNDFKFFKRENPDIMKLLLEYPEEEQLDFLKFATALGCFSKEKMVDKEGKETQTIVGQKASLAIATMLRENENMQLR